MLSRVLRSKWAVQLNIAIMRAIVKLLEILASRRDLARRLQKIEKLYEGRFQAVFVASFDFGPGFFLGAPIS